MHRWCGYDLFVFTCLSDGDDDLSKSCSQIYRSHACSIALSVTPHSSLGLVFLFRFLFRQKEDQLFSRCSDCGKRAPGSSNYTSNSFWTKVLEEGNKFAEAQFWRLGVDTVCCQGRGTTVHGYFGWGGLRESICSYFCLADIRKVVDECT